MAELLRLKAEKAKEKEKESRDRERERERDRERERVPKAMPTTVVASAPRKVRKPRRLLDDDEDADVDPLSSSPTNAGHLRRPRTSEKSSSPVEPGAVPAVVPTPPKQEDAVEEASRVPAMPVLQPMTQSRVRPGAGVDAASAERKRLMLTISTLIKENNTLEAYRSAQDKPPSVRLKEFQSRLDSKPTYDDLCILKSELAEASAFLDYRISELKANLQHSSS